MNNGYLILARTAEEQKAASTCAYSIRINNPESSVTMIIDDINNVITEYEEPFEYIIELPNKVNDDLRANDWQLLEITPYDHNVVLDCYSLVKEDHTELWNYLYHYDMCYSVSTKDFKGQRTTKQLEWHSDHNITLVIGECYYFKKDSELALEFFNFAELYMTEYESVMGKYIEARHIPRYYDSDLIHSLITSHIDSISEVTPYHENILEIIDMDVVTNDLINRNRVETNWTDYLNVWISESTKIKIQNFAINSTIAYKDVTFVTDEIYDEHRNYFRKQITVVD